jgi:hypothetical protein
MNIRLVSDGTKIKRETLGGGTPITTLHAAKNEVVAFQVVLDNSSGSIETGLDVHLPGFYGPAGHNIVNTESDPTLYVGRYIDIFVAHYTYITSRSAAGDYAWDLGRAAPDSDYIGWMPDILVPIESPGGDRTNGQGGAPFKVLANSSQSIWIDVYVPRTATAGNYSGTITIYQNSAVISTLPITLIVYDVALPDANPIRTMLPIMTNSTARHTTDARFSVNERKYHTQYVHLCKRHRINGIDCNLTVSQLSYIQGWLDGSWYDTAHGYEGPGENTGADMYVIGMYDMPAGATSGFDASDRVAVAQAFTTWFSVNTSGIVVSKGMEDEPPRERTRHPYIKAAATDCHNGGLKAMCTFWMDPDLWDYIDVFCEAGQSDITTGFNVATSGRPPYYNVQDAFDAGKYVGSYNGYLPTYGAFNILDTPLVDTRVMPLVVLRYSASFFFQWDISFYSPSISHSPWLQMTNKSTTADADGTLAVSGDDIVYTGDSRNIDGPCPTMRLKAFRRGMQDATLINMTDKSLLPTLVRKAYNDYDTLYTTQNGPPGWSRDPEVYETVRKQILEDLGGETIVLPDEVNVVDDVHITDTSSSTVAHIYPEPVLYTVENLILEDTIVRSNTYETPLIYFDNTFSFATPDPTITVSGLNYTFAGTKVAISSDTYNDGAVAHIDEFSITHYPVYSGVVSLTQTLSDIELGQALEYVIFVYMGTQSPLTTYPIILEPHGIWYCAGRTRQISGTLRIPTDTSYHYSVWVGFGNKKTFNTSILPFYKTRPDITFTPHNYA